jgi:hypothetical protein
LRRGAARFPDAGARSEGRTVHHTGWTSTLLSYRVVYIYICVCVYIGLSLSLSPALRWWHLDPWSKIWCLGFRYRSIRRIKCKLVIKLTA